MEPSDEEIAGVFKDFNNTGNDGEAEKQLMTVVYSLLALFGLLANLLFCLVIWRNEKLHTVTHVLMMNLALSNLLFLCFHPSYIITTYLLQRSFVFGTFVCKTSFSIAYVTSTASFYMMSLVAIDRWLAIFKRKYRLTRSNSICLVVFAWAISFVVAAPYMYSARVKDFNSVNEIIQNHQEKRPKFIEDIKKDDILYDEQVFENLSKILDNIKLSSKDDSDLPDIAIMNTTRYRCTSDTASNTVLIWTVVLQYVVPLLIMIPTYGHLALFVWKRAPIGVQSREKRERAHRRRRKLLVTLLSIVLFLVVCWLPLFFVNILMSWKMIHITTYTRAYIYCSIVTLAGVLVTPIFYLINDGCREQVMRLFCCRTVPASERERQALMTTNPYPDRISEAHWLIHRGDPEAQTGTTNLFISLSACGSPEDRRKDNYTPQESL
ncbi:unnamed protein product, partial [Mesorhabditis belari]|uniref:G-protein coupled receptors family 1 profile domain-containing protein n=1 Tax=Mesorhabditis belari TaxID=2138241 RepID=A0AAF3FT17_9BILA